MYQRLVTISKSRSICHLSQEPPGFSKAPNEDLKYMDVLGSFKIKKESQNSDHGCIKKQVAIYKSRSRCQTPVSILQSLKSGLRGRGCSLHLQNLDREPTFRTWVYQRLVTIYKSKSTSQATVRNLQHSRKLQIRT